MNRNFLCSNCNIPFIVSPSMQSMEALNTRILQRELGKGGLLFRLYLGDRNTSECEDNSCTNNICKHLRNINIVVNNEIFSFHFLRMFHWSVHCWPRQQPGPINFASSNVPGHRQRHGNCLISVHVRATSGAQLLLLEGLTLLFLQKKISERWRSKGEKISDEGSCPIGAIT